VGGESEGDGNEDVGNLGGGGKEQWSKSWVSGRCEHKQGRDLARWWGIFYNMKNNFNKIANILVAMVSTDNK
jgi:hypothetical protein